jgi:alpha-L-fucosidase 2
MHLDVNTQMNYWPAEVTGLGECTQPLFHWIEDTLVPSGRQTAQEIYGVGGWVAHTVSNAWGYSAPGWSTYWGFHPTGGAWMASHMWEHYLYSGDRRFLAERAYPVLRASAEFFAGYLCPDPKTGYLVSGPASSPENAFLHENGRYANTMGPTCDTVIIREILNACIQSSEILGCDEDLRVQWQEIQSQLPPFQVGQWGQLQEWLHDYPEALPQHRHTSHLLSVFPFCQVNPDDTPELAQAAQVSVARRTTPKQTWEDTGWARSMLMLYAARLRDAEAAHRHILDMQRSLTEQNLFVYHPPAAGAKGNVWEMDGNTGLCACVAEMLLQSHRNEVHLLPALPAAWANGSVTGLRARGGIEVDIEWRDATLVRAVLSSPGDAICRVRYGETRMDVQVSAGERKVVERPLDVVKGS